MRKPVKTKKVDDETPPPVGHKFLNALYDSGGNYGSGEGFLLFRISGTTAAMELNTVNETEFRTIYLEKNLVKLYEFEDKADQEISMCVEDVCHCGGELMGIYDADFYGSGGRGR